MVNLFQCIKSNLGGDHGTYAYLNKILEHIMTTLLYTTGVAGQFVQNKITKTTKKSDLKTDKEKRFSPLYKQYIEFRTPGLAKKTIRNLWAYYDAYYEELYGSDDVTEIETKDYQELVNRLLKDHKPGYVEKLVCALKGFYGYLVDEGIATKNPINRIQLPKYDNEKTFLLPDKKIMEIRDYIFQLEKPKVKYLLSFLLHARRVSEVLTEKWSNIHFEKHAYQIDGDASKNKKYLTFPLEPFLEESLMPLYEDRRSDVFILENRNSSNPYSYTWAHSKHSQMCKELGLEGFTMHMFRHMLATLAANNGVEAHEIAAMLGQKGLSSTARYFTVNLDTKSNSYKKAYALVLQSNLTGIGVQ